MGNLYVANVSANTISKITAAGVVSTFAGGFTGPTGIAFDSSGDLFISNFPINTISEIKAAPLFTSALTASGQVGSAFSYTIAATDSPTSYGLSGLPTGLGLSVNSATGVISGTPVFQGRYVGTISATTAGGVTSTTSITITISPATLSGAQTYAWGLNASGQLGNNSTTSSSVPVAVSGAGVLAGKTIVATASGSTFGLALDSAGLVYAWGSNAAGQLGNNSTTSSSVPVAVNTSGVLAGKTIVGISAANAFALAVSADGKVFAWGANPSGQLGDGTLSNSSVPEQVGGILSTKTIIAVSAGAKFLHGSGQ